MKLVRGTSFDNPIVVYQNEVDLNKVTVAVEHSDAKPPIYASADTYLGILDAMLGPFDGDYFIINEAKIGVKEKRYRVFYVEDRDGDKHMIIFMVEKERKGK